MPFDTQTCKLEIGSYNIKARVNATIPFKVMQKDFVIGVRKLINNKLK